MFHRKRSEPEDPEPVCEIDTMADREWKALSDEDRERIEEEWIERHGVWWRARIQRMRAEIDELTRKRGIFGFSTSV